jgi:hypothetical protein
MPLKIPSVGEDALAEDLLAAKDRIIKLYTSNTTPADGDTDATYTEMATLGYAEKEILGSDWSVTQNSGVAEGTAPQQTWTFTAGTAVTVYGYFVVDGLTGGLRWSERFATPKTAQYEGDQIKIVPVFTLRTGE